MSHTPSESGPQARWTPQLVHELTSGALATPAAANQLVQHRIPVFPCVPGEKRPLTAHGFQDATSDRATVASWWSRWPNANIGIPTGSASGIDVVDVDVHAAGTGFQGFDRARRAHLVTGWAWMLRTPSGGLHAYFLRSGEGEQRSWQLPGKHVDFRGDGGYVIAPPSRVIGRDGVERGYKLIAVASHQPSPVNGNALRNLLDPPRQSRPPKDLPAAGSRPEKLAHWVASRPEGARNGGLFWAACRMVEAGHPFDTTAAVLGNAAMRAGLLDHESSATIRSAYRITTRLGPVNSTGPTRAVEAVRL